jgi:hypothetical protein
MARYCGITRAWSVSKLQMASGQKRDTVSAPSDSETAERNVHLPDRPRWGEGLITVRSSTPPARMDHA